MQPEPAYLTLQAAIEYAGAFTTLIPKGTYMQLVCASRRTSRGLEGNSFWLTFGGSAGWMLATWNNRSWAVPPLDDREIAQMCLEILGTGKIPIYEVPNNLASRYSLVEQKFPFD
ncbi:MAG: hypothetical protein AB7K09_10010 [Planctomycetota bacterium]